MSVFEEMWQDLLGVAILVVFALVLYMKSTRKTWKEVIEEIKSVGGVKDE